MTDISPRITGYPGCDAAADYIRSVFTGLGFDVAEQTFNVTVPVSYGANITFEGNPELNLKIYALEPNLVVPVTTPGVTGRIVYVGAGDLKDFNSKEVKDSIVLMKFNTGYNWLNALKLGAKAVIFIEPEETVFQEAFSKSIDLPVNFPRFYMPTEDAYHLLKSLENSEPLECTIRSSMIWEKRTGRNIVATLQGSEYPDRILILSAHYDSYSVVPALSTGANDAASIATLLELARTLNELKPKYTIMFVAFAGHHQGLTGSRNFAGDFFLGEHRAVGNKVVMHLNIQISTWSSLLATSNTDRLVYGDMYGGVWGHATYYMWQNINEYILELATRIKLQLGREFQIVAGMNTYRYSADIREKRMMLTDRHLMHDAAPLAFIVGPAFSIITVDYGEHVNVPIDRYDRLNLKNLEDNVEGVFYITYGLVFTEDLEENLRAFEVVNNFLEISGTTATYNKSIDDYQPLSNALVVLTFQQDGKLRTLSKYIGFSDEHGRFRFRYLSVGSMNIEAYKIDNVSGNPVYYPDMGRYSWTPSFFSMVTNVEDVGYCVLFEGGSLVLFDAIFPWNLELMTTSSNEIRSMAGPIEVLDAANRIGLEFYGKKALVDGTRSVSTVFLPSDTPTVLFLRTITLGLIPAGMLTNSSSESPKGNGYEVKVGEQRVLYVPLEVINSYNYTIAETISTLSRFNLASGLLEKYEMFKNILSSALRALKEERYDVTHELSLRAWAYALSSYEDADSLTLDIVAALPFFAFLMVPFTLVIQYVVLGVKGRKTIFTSICIMMVLIFIFSLLHPGFSLASNPYMLVMSIAVALMSAPTVAILLSNLVSVMKRVAAEISGRHFVAVSRGGMALLYFRVGFENLRKRKLRSFLTVTAVLLGTLALVLFTSIEALTVFVAQDSDIPATYQGVYIRPMTWPEGISQNVVEVLETRYSNMSVVLPRAWLYGPSPSVGLEDPFAKFKVWRGNRYTNMYAFMGLTAQEVRTDFIPASVSRGRWFVPTDENVCMLPDATAEALNTTIGDDIYALGRNLEVIGILDAEILYSLTELDGEEITPFDQTVPQQETLHVKPEALPLVIVPYKLLLQMDHTISTPYTASVSVVVEDSDHALEITEQIFNAHKELYVFSGSGETSKVYFYRNTYTLLGWEMQTVPLLLCSVMILNIMLGAVYQRKRDIFVFSSVGLSPSQILLLFLAESTAYAILGSFIGYIIAMVFLNAAPILSLNVPFRNYSSSWVVISVASTILVTIASTSYPAYIASRLVTPSLKRAWRPETKPLGDTWSIKLPFVFAKETEAHAISNYLMEFFGLHAGEVDLFSAADVEYAENHASKSITMKSRLEPYELGIVQRVQIVFSQDREHELWKTAIILRRLGGNHDEWARLNLKLVDAVRKQFLLWRSLSDEEKGKYMK